MAINKLHPMYLEYMRKCEDLARRGKEEADQIECSSGLDGPLGDIHRKYLNELKELQQEYFCLFTEE